MTLGNMNVNKYLYVLSYSYMKLIEYCYLHCTILFCDDS